ncbi:cadherin-like protein 26 [Herpailurus yagouaroundi]|uniref:cadherin-like protein 26 n=1 Tax=Herpailurus yagouaroundi TaxID=1608482 RepID=UPI001AD68129|nr:cadherin-like protein 26 [Puma yagouaroundi]
MGSGTRPSLPLLPVLLLVLLLQVNSVNSFRQENEDLAQQTKGESHRPLRRSKRRWVITTLELEEEDPGPFPKLVGELFNDMSQNTSLMYLIRGPGVDEYPEIGLFSIEDHKNGQVYVHRPVDRETTPSFTVYFDVLDRLSGRVMDSSLIFNIRIGDVNDHAPQFPQKEFNISVKENHAAGQPIFRMLTVDLDQENTPNSEVLYFLISQTPILKESGFHIDRISGEIQLSGCLDYETAPRFTLLVSARDFGEPPLSSTATVHINVEEGNNHMPTFTQENYKIQISEGRANWGVLRLLVQDADLPFTSAWRVKFNISQGDEEGRFDILTDPETNEGILNVIKPLDYETHPMWRLVITVENEEALFSCEGGRLREPRKAAASATVSVQVTDVNDPPAFHPRSFVVSEVDGAGPGIQLGIFNATDPDRAAGRIRYKLVRDPASWVTVDELSGTVTTRKQIDRESPYVNDSFYVIIAHAIDDGLPPQTGTGTLMLFLSDINDNAPALHPHSRYMEVCESAANETLLLEAEDGDLEPFADPFTFELDKLWGNAEDTWKLGANRGRSVELWMLRSLPPGNYSVPLFIRDKQGLSRKQTVHVRVCSCPDGVTCAEPSVTGAGLLVGALVPPSAAFVALAVALLFLLRCYCGSEATGHRRSVPRDQGQQTLIMYNDESKAISTQGRPDVRDQMSVRLLNTAGAEAELGAQDAHDVLAPASRTAEQEDFVLGTSVHYRSSPPVAGCDMPFEPRGTRNKYSTPVYRDAVVPRRCPEASAGTMAETLSQKLCGLDALAGDTGHRPHIYAEEGECEGAESLSSLACSEPDSGLKGCSARRNVC